MLKRFVLSIVVMSFVVTSVYAGASFDGGPDNQRDDLGYYYAITGGKFPTGTTPNGNNGSGGTFRRIYDDSSWGSASGQWLKDDWFPENAGIALTLKSSGSIVYDNNGIEDGTYGSYYDGTGVEKSSSVPGLYRAYSMSNNFDHIYAGYFLLQEETIVDEIVGYFDENAGFDRNNPSIRYQMNIWSNVEEDLLPVNTGAFAGDVFCSDSVAGQFATSDTGVDRIFGNDYQNAHDDIFRLTYNLDAPMTLDPGVYWFSHDARVVPLPPSALMLLTGVLGVGGFGVWRRRR